MLIDSSRPPILSNYEIKIDFPLIYAYNLARLVIKVIHRQRDQGLHYLR